MYSIKTKNISYIKNKLMNGEILSKEILDIKKLFYQERNDWLRNFVTCRFRPITEIYFTSTIKDKKGAKLWKELKNVSYLINIFL